MPEVTGHVSGELGGWLQPTEWLHGDRSQLSLSTCSWDPGGVSILSVCVGGAPQTTPPGPAGDVREWSRLRVGFYEQVSQASSKLVLVVSRHGEAQRGVPLQYFTNPSTTTPLAPFSLLAKTALNPRAG